MSPEIQRHVLIVDDDLDGAEGMADMLDAHGYGVSIANDYREALVEAASCGAQVALVDLRLGVENGLDLIAEMQERWPDIVSVVVTANADKESAIGALRRGAYDYLTKPVDPDEMFQALHRAFEKVRLTEENRRMIKELESAKEHAERLALRDSLTGLANRYSFQRQLARAINHARRAEKLAGILIIDLDGFKQVNDTHGHAMGDELLQQIAQRLERCVRNTDTVARLGGDEFAVILVNVDGPDGVERPAEVLLESICSPVMIGDVALEVSASIGISLCPLDGDDAGELIRRADVALYAAKEAGPGVVRLYDAELDLRGRIQRQLKRDLRRALEEDELVMFYQPQVSLQTNEVIGVEALLRWNYPGRGVLPPAEFIDAAETSGLILEIGRWVINTACHQVHDWDLHGLGALRMAVNVSPRQLRGNELIDAVETALAETGVDPSRLELELTENSVMVDEDQAAAKFLLLRGLGIQLAIDDFGTGHSSLARLKEYPVNRLKIDRTFVDKLIHDKGDQSICLATVQLAASLGLSVIAEGIESQDQLDYLRDIGCAEAQGFYFSKPLPAVDFEAWLAEWRAATPNLIVPPQAATGTAGS